MTVTLADIRLAADRLGSAIAQTPFLHSQTLSELTGAEIWLKFENLHFTASFKERGALNKLLTLDEGQRRRGVVAVSAGNHAQGVALHARNLGIQATIVMPASTPSVKVASTTGFGARVELFGKDFAEASTAVSHYVEAGLTFIPPFNDPYVLAGQGTVGLEMVQQGPPLDAVLIAVGGGGLIGGIATVFKALSPQTQVIGVQSELYPSMAVALGYHSGEIVGGTSVAEGIAVAWPGELTLEIAKHLVDDIVVVPEARIEDSVALLLQIEKTLCEGAGAVGLAAVLGDTKRFRSKRVGLVLSGGNIDVRVLTAVLQRHLARVGQLVRIRVTMPDNAGVLGAISTIIGMHGGNILDVDHDRVFGDASARSVRVMFMVELPDRERSRTVAAALRAAGFEADIITTDEPVKSALRQVA